MDYDKSDEGARGKAAKKAGEQQKYRAPVSLAAPLVFRACVACTIWQDHADPCGGGLFYKNNLERNLQAHVIAP
ncbi:hypothetical protein [Aliiroseovarius crassostreae]|uniref:hypothetical protein n=1 Tax=Aliiroseovarius crassostreae TaxID=154981 RepID=UPI003C7E057B